MTLLLFALLALLGTPALAASPKAWETDNDDETEDTTEWETEGGDDAEDIFEPFYFVVCGDPQIDQLQVFNKFTLTGQRVSAIDPPFTLVAGDMVTNRTAQEYNWYQTAIKSFLMPVRLVPGNHDITTPAEVTDYRNRFGPDYYRFTWRNCDFICLDSVTLRDAATYPDEYAEQWAWLERTIDDSAAAPRTHRILFLHHPPFSYNENETDDYWSFPIPERQRLLALVRRGGIRTILTGHLHKTHTVETNDFSIYTTAGSGLYFDDNSLGYRVFSVFKDRIDQTYLRLDQPDVTPPDRPAWLTPASLTRRGFKLNWPAVHDDCAMLRYDVYRDGQPIGRTLGTTFTDPAPLTHGGNAAPTYTVRAVDVSGNQSLDSPSLRPWRATATSDGQSVDESDTDTLVMAGTDWAYQDGFIPPPNDWITPTFVDATWQRGPAPLGYGAGDEATRISYGGDPTHKPTAAWFRRMFTVDEPTSYARLTLCLQCDDGASVWLNGVELVRDNLPAGALTFQTRACDEITTAAWQVFELDPIYLRPGDNALAVEVRQAAPGDHDLRFNLELTGWLKRQAAPKNVILMIGDGMGFEVVRAAGMYRDGIPGGLFFESLPNQAEVQTASANSAITDSAAAATAMATGHKVNNSVISLALPGDGQPLPTMLEMAQAQGRQTALVTTSYLLDATPAAFGAHATTRYDTATIADGLFHGSHPDLLMGGALDGLTTETAASAGYQVVTDRAGLLGLRPIPGQRIAGLFDTGTMPYEADGPTTLPHLTEMTRATLAWLEPNPRGFFTMIEGALIDKAEHANNLGRAIGETIEFSNAVKAAAEWVDAREATGRRDTLLIAVPDHECGGLSIMRNNGQGQLPDVTWSTIYHTGVNVPIYALGQGASQVHGVLDNTRIFHLMTEYCDERTVTPFGKAWRYRPAGALTWGDWRQPAFNDADWTTGTAPLGHGTGQEATTLAVGSTTATLTTCFRRHFTLASSPLGYAGFTLRLRMMGGAAVWLNGREILRHNLPDGPLSPDTPALGLEPIPGPTDFIECFVNPSWLNEGENVLAVEVHRVAGRTDQLFDLELFADIRSLRQPWTAGPGVTERTETSAVIGWLTNRHTSTVLRWGTAPDALTHVIENPTLATRHEARLDGLTPGVRYYYAIGASDSALPHPGSVYSFVSVARNGSQDWAQYR